MVVWSENNIGTSTDIYGRRISQDGNILDEQKIPISVEPLYQEFPSVAFDGTSYLVSWQDFRSGTNWDIYGAKVSTAGEVLNTYEVSTQPRNQYSPAFARGNGDQILITYSGWIDSINGHPANTMRIWGKFYPFTGVEEDAGFRIHDTGFSLNVYPNPIQKECCIKYNLPREAKVAISIFDVTGRLVKEIINEKQNGGKYSRVFNMTDLAQGVYFIRLNTENESATKKIIILR